ncbi:GNAT family N-acetyltransferase [Allokutzneria multivorans]|uniref:GNAT family N-acetyltransferase n=1 Tax=Allokutzneria multivorans TaxID=1142134 RepID=A0ABP7SFT4_9PSEU
MQPVLCFYGVVLTFREITDENRDAVCDVRVRPGQEKFVDSVEKSLRDAFSTPEAAPWYRAVYRGDVPVGFVMLSWNVVPRPGILGPYFLWRLLVGEEYQGRGFGREIVRMVVEMVRADGGRELLTSYQPGVGSPWPFYRGLGFVETGEVEEGEVVVRLFL